MATDNQENADSQKGDPEGADDSQEHQQEDEKFTPREKQLYERLKKTESKLKEVEGKRSSEHEDADDEADKPKAKSQSESLSPEDIYTLIDAKVDKQDIETVKKTAKILGVSIADALEDDSLKAILKSRADKRKVAEATNTKTARPGATKPTGEQLIKEAAAGNIPKKGSSEAEELFWARRGGRRS